MAIAPQAVPAPDCCLRAAAAHLPPCRAGPRVAAVPQRVPPGGRVPVQRRQLGVRAGAPDAKGEPRPGTVGVCVLASLASKGAHLAAYSWLTAPSICFTTPPTGRPQEGHHHPNIFQGRRHGSERQRRWRRCWRPRGHSQRRQRAAWERRRRGGAARGAGAHWEAHGDVPKADRQRMGVLSHCLSQRWALAPCVPLLGVLQLHNLRAVCWRRRADGIRGSKNACRGMLQRVNQGTKRRLRCEKRCGATCGGGALQAHWNRLYMGVVGALAREEAPVGGPAVAGLHGFISKVPGPLTASGCTKQGGRLPEGAASGRGGGEPSGAKGSRCGAWQGARVSATLSPEAIGLFRLNSKHLHITFDRFVDGGRASRAGGHQSLGAAAQGRRVLARAAAALCQALSLSLPSAPAAPKRDRCDAVRARAGGRPRRSLVVEHFLLPQNILLLLLLPLPLPGLRRVLLPHGRARARLLRGAAAATARAARQQERDGADADDAGAQQRNVLRVAARLLTQVWKGWRGRGAEQGVPSGAAPVHMASTCPTPRHRCLPRRSQYSAAAAALAPQNPHSPPPEQRRREQQPTDEQQLEVGAAIQQRAAGAAQRCVQHRPHAHTGHRAQQERRQLHGRQAQQVVGGAAGGGCQWFQEG